MQALRAILEMSTAAAVVAAQGCTGFAPAIVATSIDTTAIKTTS
jgi:hypothetical protein